MGVNMLNAADIKIPGHIPFCKCVRCKVGVLDRNALLAIPMSGTCQQCRYVIDDVKIGEVCPKCGFGGSNGKNVS